MATKNLIEALATKGDSSYIDIEKAPVLTKPILFDGFYVFGIGGTELSEKVLGKVMIPKRKFKDTLTKGSLISLKGQLISTYQASTSDVWVPFLPINKTSNNLGVVIQVDSWKFTNYTISNFTL